MSTTDSRSRHIGAHRRGAHRPGHQFAKLMSIWRDWQRQARANMDVELRDLQEALDADVAELAWVTQTPPAFIRPDRPEYGLWQVLPELMGQSLERWRTPAGPDARTQKSVNDALDALAATQFGGWRQRWITGLDAREVAMYPSDRPIHWAKASATMTPAWWEDRYGSVIFDEHLGMLEIDADKSRPNEEEPSGPAEA